MNLHPPMHDPSYKFEILKGACREAANDMNSSIKKMRRKWLTLKITTAILSSAITVIIGLKMGIIGENIALIISAILTILTTISSFLNLDKDIIVSHEAHAKFDKLALEIILYQLDENSTYSAEDYKKFKEDFLVYSNQLSEQELEALKSGLGNNTVSHQAQ